MQNVCFFEDDGNACFFQSIRLQNKKQIKWVFQKKCVLKWLNIAVFSHTVSADCVQSQAMNSGICADEAWSSFQVIAAHCFLSFRSITDLFRGRYTMQPFSIPFVWSLRFDKKLDVSGTHLCQTNEDAE